MKRVLLCILDGCGLRDEANGNAFKNAKKPNFDKLWSNYPHSKLIASGEEVGLPKGQMGNSEVGHMNIGAGRIVYQPLGLINKKINDKEFYDNENIIEVINHVKENNSKLHLFGLLSDGGIHSHYEHLFALIDMCKMYGVKNVYYHIFTDGRDTSPTSGIKYIKRLEDKIKDTGIGSIATISGRFYAMDRDNRYERLKRAYDAIIYGEADYYNSACDAWKSNQDRGITDEFIEPAVIDKEGIVDSGDGLICFNYRPDRLRELFSAITNDKFSGFERKDINNIKLVTMMPVSDEVICKNAYRLEDLINTCGEYVAELGFKQLRIAETEKYAHVTYFFDGGVEKELNNCTRVLIPSPKVLTYDLKPEMSAYEITDRLISEFNNHYDMIILNFANGDMVGHTGKYDAAVKAVETIDNCLGKIIDNINLDEYTVIITADHGNCEVMINDDGSVNTQHTTNLVPCIITDNNYKLKDGKLGDLAPTILDIMGIDIPKEMTGSSLIERL